MSNTKDNKKSKDNNQVKYYSSVHTESGFITSLTLVDSEHGSDYYAMKFNASRGNSNKPLKAAHSVRVNGVQAKQVIEQIATKVNAQLAANSKLWDANQGKDALSILITLNISDTIAKSYMNKHTGKDTLYIDGRCTSIAYVRIGDELIFQKQKSDKQETTEKPVVDADTDFNEAGQVPEATQTPEVDVDTDTPELEQEVILDPTAQDFEQRKAKLKDQGYTWNSDKKVWSL